MVLSFLKKHKKFFKSTKNSTENQKVINIYPHSIHIYGFCTEKTLESVFVPHTSVGLPNTKNARRRKKNRHSRRFSLFSFLAFGFLLQDFVAIVLFLAIFARFCKIPNFFNFLCFTP